MIVAVTTYTVAKGEKGKGAGDWIRRVVELFNDRFSVPSTAKRSLSGKFGIIVREARFESFAAWEEFLWKTLPAGPEWPALAKEMDEKQYFSDTEFQFFRVIE